ncbi:MAG: pseudouridine synthase [Leadbetterella sp.]|nr:pseudouridine synthase [Leadbetterella sp.]
MKRNDSKGPGRPRKNEAAGARNKKDEGAGRPKFSGDAPRQDSFRSEGRKDSPRFSRDNDSGRSPGFGRDRDSFGAGRSKDTPRFRDSDNSFGAGKRRFSDEAPRYKKNGDFERGSRPAGRNFSGRDESPRYKKDDGFERGSRPEGRKFSGRDESPRYKKDGDFERGSRPESRNFSGRDEAPRYKKDGDFERSSRPESRNFSGRDESPRYKKDGDFRPDRRKFTEGDSREDRGSFRSFNRDTERDSFRKYDNPERGRKPFSSGDELPGKRTFGRRNDTDGPARRKKDEPFEYGKGAKPQRRPDYSEENLIKNIPEKQRKKIESTGKKSDDQIRLNRYIANSGLCSRREADDLIESGQITVNGKTITEMGYQVKVTDVVKYGRKILNPEKLVYVLLNKPKDFITTTEDPEGRRTVMDLVAKAGSERIYPVGRLDRATTGLLLFTNDGELAEKLSHPSHEIRKIYQVEIDKPLSSEDFEKLVEGVELEDGFIKPDEVSVITPDQQVIGIEIHSGKNRVVRRIFEQLGYDVTQLDRTTYAGLTKKDLPRGNWRFLTEKEVIRLKYMI